MSLEERLETETFDPSSMKRMESGHVMTFTPEKSQQRVRQEEKEKEHRRERLAVRRFVLTVLLSDPISPFVLFRSAKALKKDRVAPKFWLGKRVK